ncbi:peptidylprolyl isomerase [Corynebacterium lizhenjunii]|uniref:Peptidylprolyl isomerase n=1 Tax=Corynebacterium lizhenjunii TaxID=2709394 RepID=A0A7T0KCX4_9CORY|nr:peptidylprolyl isomerase [Corynebacterium lizhenjunii]QPK78232.1 peptidylprolyl isomerase [Corynebacterium lizhenjunii]
MTDNSKRGSEALSQLERELKSRDRKDKARPLGVVMASLAAIVVLGGGITYMATRDGEETKLAEQVESSETTTTEEVKPVALTGERAEALPETVQCTYEEDGRDNNGAKLPSGKDVSTKGTATVTLATNQGDIPLELDRAVAPCTVNAITELASQGYYDDTVCHRMTNQGIFVIQCGDPTGTGSGGPGFQFANEYPTDELGDAPASGPVLYPKGSLAMANSGPGTNGSQFFINFDDSPLAPDYTYFGTVTTEGMKTVEKISELGIQGGAPDGPPAEEVKINKATVKS